MAQRRAIPSFRSFKIETEARYKHAANDKLFRIGLKVNTPPTCNWACPYCYVGDSDVAARPRQKVGIEQGPDKDPGWAPKMKGWIDQAKDLGARAVTVNGTFEPTTAPDYLEIIGYCVDKGMAVTLVTNGSLLSDNDIDHLYELGINILTKMNVPLVSPNDARYHLFCEIQKELSGKVGNARAIYESQSDLINKLIDRGFSRRGDEPDYTRLGLESVITARNLPYLPEFIAQLRDLNLYAHVEVLKIQGFAHNNRGLAPTKEQLRNFFLKIAKQDEAMGYEPWTPKPPYVAGACHENLYRVDLHASGLVKPCPGIETTIGDLHDSSMQSLLSSSALHIIRNLEEYIQGDCKTCDLFKSRECYGGCRGTTYQTLKSRGFGEYECWVGSDPSCWRVQNVLDSGVVSADVFDKSI